MTLTADDLQNITQIIRFEVNEIFDNKIDGKLIPIKKDLSLLKDMVMDIRYRLDFAELPAIVNQLDETTAQTVENTRRIGILEKKCR